MTQVGVAQPRNLSSPLKFQKLAKNESIGNYSIVQTLTEKLIEQGLTNRVLSDRQLERVIGPASSSRYGLVNRALKAQELVRIRRGLYVLAPRLRTQTAHPFAIAQSILPGSYISFETALSHHGWIPESVRIIASVVPGRKSADLEHPMFGSFAFHPLALNRSYFLQSIERRQFGQQMALIAKPLRALMDLVAFRKLKWRGLGLLTDGMRIDPQSLHSVSRKDFQALAKVYKQKGPNEFLHSLAQELNRD